MKSLGSRRDITRAAALAVGMSVTMLFASCSKVVEERGYILGMLDYVCGFPLVVMDVTKDVITATPISGEYKAPMNQFGRIRTRKEILDGTYKLPPVRRVQ